MVRTLRACRVRYYHALLGIAGVLAVADLLQGGNNLAARSSSPARVQVFTPLEVWTPRQETAPGHVWTAYSLLASSEIFPAERYVKRQSSASSEEGNSSSSPTYRPTLTAHASLTGKTSTSSCGIFSAAVQQATKHAPRARDQQRAISAIVTIVTQFYLVPTKHSVRQFNEWIKNFILPVQSPMHFFTDCKTLRKRQRFRVLLQERERLLPGKSYIQLLSLQETRIFRELSPLVSKQQLIDPERFTGNNYHVDLLWLMKAEVLRMAERRNIFNSKWFIYCDIGAFRSKHLFHSWPSPSRLQGLPTDRLLFEMVYPIDEKRRPSNLEAALQNSSDLIYDDHLAGGFIGANTAHNMTGKFMALVLDTAQLLFRRGHLMCKDQVVYNAVFLRHPEMFTIISSPGYKDPWFYMTYWLANETERGDAPDVTPITLQS